jgi:methionyl-tRNA synthetase
MDRIEEASTIMISLDDFKKVVLRIGEILHAEPVSGTDRLFKLTLDMGEHRRTLVGGLAGSYAPEDLCGKKVVVVANLEPARIRGVESQGMLLGVGCENPTEVALLTVDRPVPNGAVVL